MAVGTQKTNQTNKRQTYAFRDDISSRGKKLKTKTDAKMESRPKSATAENNLQNTSDYIAQKKVNRSKTCSLEQNSKGSLAATTKPHRGVCVGLTYDLSYLELFFISPDNNSCEFTGLPFALSPISTGARLLSAACERLLGFGIFTNPVIIKDKVMKMFS